MKEEKIKKRFYGTATRPVRLPSISTTVTGLLAQAERFEKRNGFDIEMTLFSDGSHAVRDTNGAFLFSGNDADDLMQNLCIENWSEYVRSIAAQETVTVDGAITFTTTKNKMEKERKMNRYEVTTTTGNRITIEADHCRIEAEADYTSMNFYKNYDVVAMLSVYTIESVIILKPIETR